MHDGPDSELPAVAALLRRMAQADGDAAAIAAFEAALHALPALCSAAPFAAAARRYAAAGEAEPAALLLGLARQLTGAGARPPLPAEAEAVLADPDPAGAVRAAITDLTDAGRAEPAVTLFGQVAAYLPPVADYWVYHRLSGACAALGRARMAFLLASLALQLEPMAKSSLEPARAVVAWLARHGAWSAAARLAARRLQANPGEDLLDEPLAASLRRHAGALVAPPVHGRRDRVVVPASIRAAAPVPAAGPELPACLRALLAPLERPAITVSELDGAAVLIANGSVSVWAADGEPLAELSAGSPPGLVWRTLRARERGGAATGERTLDASVLLSDMFPAPNLCHFLLDQATRLTLYAQAGISLADCVAIGPEPRQPYQREIARRFGARHYLGTGGFGRVRVQRLHVLSNCHHLRHPAHLGAEWALAAVRAAFADLLAQPAPPRRLLVSREDASGRRLANEEELLALLRPHGFERIVPGRMSLADQVRAFAAVTHVVSPHGAALAGIVFCPPAARVLEIFHPQYGTWAYAMLAAPLRLDYAALTGTDAANGDAGASVPPRGASSRDIRVAPEQIAAWLSRHAHV